MPFDPTLKVMRYMLTQVHGVFEQDAYCWLIGISGKKCWKESKCISLENWLHLCDGTIGPLKTMR